MDKYLAEISRTSFLLILSLLAGLSLALVVTYILLPKYKTYISTNESYAVLSTSVNDSKNYHTEMEKTQASISALEQQMNGEYLHLPAQQFESHVISELQTLAWKNNIELGGVRPRQGQVIDHYREAIFDVDLSGEYFDFYRFLLELEQASGFLVISEFSITPKLPITVSSGLEVTMSVASYRQERQ